MFNEQPQGVGGSSGRVVPVPREASDLKSTIFTRPVWREALCAVFQDLDTKKEKEKEVP
jgi:hypothetical protein